MNKINYNKFSRWVIVFDGNLLYLGLFKFDENPDVLLSPVLLYIFLWRRYLLKCFWMASSLRAGRKKS